MRNSHETICIKHKRREGCKKSYVIRCNLYVMAHFLDVSFQMRIMNQPLPTYRSHFFNPHSHKAHILVLFARSTLLYYMLGIFCEVTLDSSLARIFFIEQIRDKTLVGHCWSPSCLPPPIRKYSEFVNTPKTSYFSGCRRFHIHMIYLRTKFLSDSQRKRHSRSGQLGNH